MDVAHQKFSIIPLLTVYYGVVDVGDHGVSVGHHGMGPGNDYVCIDGKFRLGMPSCNSTVARGRWDIR